jgi:mono/diheme cytochrome c family protein
MKLNILYCISGICLSGMIACSPAGGEKRGHEFMPDMVHSTAFEANLYDYYYYNTWGTEDEYMSYAMPRNAVSGTIARGNVNAALSDSPDAILQANNAFTGGHSPGGVVQTINGAVPYSYADTDADRVRASTEITRNPYPITDAGLTNGKELYTIYCGICHGAKGDGLGYLVREVDPAKGITAGVYPAAPANFLKADFIDTTAGFFYHSIMYGKTMMGAYADKLTYEERWQVIHYIRSLQAKSQSLAYNENENTFTQDLPGGPVLKRIAEMEAAKINVQSVEQESAHEEADDADGGH